MKFAVSLADAVLAGHDKRVQGYDTRHDLILDSVTLPQFRMRWLEDDDRKSRAFLIRSLYTCSLLYEQLHVVQQQQLDLQHGSDDVHEASLHAESDDCLTLGVRHA